MRCLNHCIPAHLKCPLLNLYLDNIAIRHPELGGNDAVHNFDILKRSVSTTIKTSYNERLNSVFPLIFIRILTEFKLLI